VAFFERGGGLINVRNWPLSSATVALSGRDFQSMLKKTNLTRVLNDLEGKKHDMALVEVNKGSISAHAYNFPLSQCSLNG